MLLSIADTLRSMTDALTGLGLTVASFLAQGGDGEQELTLIQKLLGNPLILPAGLFFLFYVTFLAPERRRKAEEARLMASLKKNDRVVTVGGIHGTIVAVSPDSNIVTVRIDENSNTRIKLNRSAIVKVVDASKENNKDTKDKEKETDTKETK